MNIKRGTKPKRKNSFSKRYDFKKKYCPKCTDNFYNGNNPHGIKECWHLIDAQVVWRKPVHLSDRPPWNRKKIRVLDCQHIKGICLTQ